ncbi:MAG: hypothetical protein WEE36_05260 [Acidimicrobiia bacterium]
MKLDELIRHHADVARQTVAGLEPPAVAAITRTTGRVWRLTLAVAGLTVGGAAIVLLALLIFAGADDVPITVPFQGPPTTVDQGGATVTTTMPIPDELVLHGVELQDEILADGAVTWQELSRAIEAEAQCKIDNGMTGVTWYVDPSGHSWGGGHTEENPLVESLCFYSYVDRVISGGPRWDTATGTAIAEGEMRLAVSADWVFVGFVNQEGMACYRVAPIVDSWCSTEQEWAAAGAFIWGSTWGSDPEAWVYGLIDERVARVALEFHSGATADAILIPASPFLGFGGFIYGFDADSWGLFTVITAYDTSGEAVGRYDLRDDCGNHIRPGFDARVEEICAP